LAFYRCSINFDLAELVPSIRFYPRASGGKLCFNFSDPGLSDHQMSRSPDHPISFYPLAYPTLPSSYNAENSREYADSAISGK
jgi:hypothetical protein